MKNIFTINYSNENFKLDYLNKQLDINFKHPFDFNNDFEKIFLENFLVFSKNIKIKNVKLILNIENLKKRFINLDFLDDKKEIEDYVKNNIRMLFKNYKDELYSYNIFKNKKIFLAIINTNFINKFIDLSKKLKFNIDEIDLYENNILNMFTFLEDNFIFIFKKINCINFIIFHKKICFNIFDFLDSKQYMIFNLNLNLALIDFKIQKVYFLKDNFKTFSYLENFFLSNNIEVKTLESSQHEFLT